MLLNIYRKVSLNAQTYSVPTEKKHANGCAIFKQEAGGKWLAGRSIIDLTIIIIVINIDASSHSLFATLHQSQHSKI
jgi:hypothetical protein